jgi:hypothetical protein
MEPKKFGITLIVIGLLFFTLQLDANYRDYAYLAMGLLGVALWWKIYRVQGLLAISLVGIAIGLRQLLSLHEGLGMLLISVAFLIPWIVQGLKAKQHWTLVLSIIFAINTVFSWQGAWFVINLDVAWAPLAIGMAFAIVYIYTRQVGFLIPAALLSGIGIITMLPRGIFQSWMMFLALSLAFASVWVIHTRTKGDGFGEKYWPLFPASFLAVFGIAVGVAEGFSQDLFVPLFLGIPAVILLIVYGFHRKMGILIPGLMLGSVSLWFVTGTDHVSLLLFFMAISFLLVFVLETRCLENPAGRWWPLIPAVILGANGAVLMAASDDRLAAYYNNINSIVFGLVFIGVGLLVIFGRNNTGNSGD